MDGLAERSLGLVIAYLVPGFVTVLALSESMPLLTNWLSAGADGGGLYVLLVSVGLGVVWSAVRWAILDTALYFTGVRPPKLDYSRLEQNLGAFEGVIHNHYRYYQFYGNLLVALLVSLVIVPGWPEFVVARRYALGIALGVLAGVLVAAARDSLLSCYKGLSSLLARSS
jgi:hypothetical protein